MPRIFSITLAADIANLRSVIAFVVEIADGGKASGTCCGSRSGKPPLSQLHSASSLC